MNFDYRFVYDPRPDELYLAFMEWQQGLATEDPPTLDELVRREAATFDHWLHQQGEKLCVH
jgi:hypothetical protein